MVIIKALLYMVWAGAAIIVSQLAVGYIMLWMVGAETFVQPVTTAIYSVLSYLLAMVLIIVIPKLITDKKKASKKGSRKSKNSVSAKTYLAGIGIKGWPTWADIGLAPLGMIVYLLFATALVALFSLFPWFNAEEVQNVGFNTYISGLDRMIAFFIIVVVAPIVEEIIFRGWLYSRIKDTLLKKYSKVASIIISNLLVSLGFGIIHMQWNVGVNVFAMSIVLCAMREITGTIYSGILLHMLKNGVAFYLLYVLGIQ